MVLMMKLGTPVVYSPFFIIWGWGGRGTVKEVGIVKAPLPAGEDMGKVASVVDDALQHNGEVVLVTDECLGTLRREKNEDVSAIHSPHTVGETHVVEANNQLQ